MVVALKSLHFKKGVLPSKQQQKQVAEALAALLEQAATLGHVHVLGEMQRGIAWGGKGSNPLASAWTIVTNFIQRIKDWLAGQDGEISEEDIAAEVASLAETVGDVEVQSAIESAVLDALQEQGVTQIVSIAQPGACAMCQANADQGPINIGDTFSSGDDAPPYHGHCRCNIAPA